MEPTKIENQFREGLKNHEIQPSAQAWDRLDAMLAVAEKPKKSFNWLRLVACFIGIVIISSVFYFQSEQPTESSIEVVENEKVAEPIQKTITNKEIIKTEIVIVEEKVPNQNQKIQQNKTISNSINTQKTGVQSSSQPINPVVIQEIVAIPTKVEKTNLVNIEKSQTHPYYINPSTLLADVENKKLDAKLNLPKSTYKADPKTLLSQVDGELDQSFREKVFTKIAKNYQTIKVAVAERNEK